MDELVRDCKEPATLIFGGLFEKQMHLRDFRLEKHFIFNNFKKIMTIYLGIISNEPLRLHSLFTSIT